MKFNVTCSPSSSLIHIKMRNSIKVHTEGVDVSGKKTLRIFLIHVTSTYAMYLTDSYQCQRKHLLNFEMCSEERREEMRRKALSYQTRESVFMPLFKNTVVTN